MIDFPNVLNLMFEVLRRYFDLYSNYAALSIISHFVKNQFDNLNEETRSHTKLILLKMVEMPRARTQPIKEFAANILSYFGLYQFFNEWPTFLTDMISSSHFFVLHFFIVNFEDAHYVSSHNKVRIKTILIENAKSILQLIYSIALSNPKSLITLSYLVKFFPIQYVNNVNTLIPLFTTFIENPSTRSNAISCLYFIFERDDANKIINDYGLQFLPLIIRQSIHQVPGDPQNNTPNKLCWEPQCGLFFGNFFASHFEQLLEIIKNSDNSSINLEQNLPDILRLLSDPGWTGSNQTDIDDSSFESLYDYWNLWSTILTLFSSEFHNMSYLISNLNDIFASMYPLLGYEIDDQYNISEPVLKSLSAICSLASESIYYFLMKQPLSKSLCVAILSCGSHISISKRIMLIDYFIELEQKSRDLNLISFFLPVIAHFSSLFQIHDTIFQKFMQSVSKFLEVSNIQLKNSLSYSLLYIAVKNPSVFYINKSELLNIIIKIISKRLDPSCFSQPFFSNLFKCASHICMHLINDDFPFEEVPFFFDDIFQLVLTPIFEFYSTSDETLYKLFHSPCWNYDFVHKMFGSNEITEEMATREVNISKRMIQDYSNGLEIIISFIDICPLVAKLYNNQLITISHTILLKSDIKNEQTSIIIEKVYSLLYHIYLAITDLSDFIQKFLQLLDIVSNNPHQIEYFIPLYLSIYNLSSIYTEDHENSIDNNMKDKINQSIYDICIPYIEEPDEKSISILRFLKEISIWNYGIECPLSSISKIIDKFPFDSLSLSLKIIEGYLLDSNYDHLVSLLLSSTSTILNLLLSLLTDEIFSRKFKLEVRCLQNLFNSIFFTKFDFSIFLELFCRIIREKIPELSEDSAKQLAQNLKSNFPNFKKFFTEIENFLTAYHYKF